MSGGNRRWAEVEVAALLAQVAQDAGAATGGAAAVRVDLHPDAPPRLTGDREMVREVLDLVRNAVENAGSATLTARAEGPYLRIDVRDEGPGIPAGEQAQPFDRPGRDGTARTKQVPGTGLSIVKRLVAAHGGLLGVSSRPGEGATFWVTFPTRPPDGAP